MPNNAAPLTATVHIPALSGRTIADLQAASHDAALVLHADGHLDVVPSLTAEPVPDATLVLRHPARAWADEFVDAIRDRAVERGTSTHLQTLRKDAAAAATAELREEQMAIAAAEKAAAQRLAARRPAQAAPARQVVPTPPVLAPMRRPEPQTLREWSDLLDALDLLDRMGLQVVPAAA